MMRKRELEKLLYKAVADALGVEVRQESTAQPAKQARATRQSRTNRQPERAAA